MILFQMMHIEKMYLAAEKNHSEMVDLEVLREFNSNERPCVESA